MTIRTTTHKCRQYVQTQTSFIAANIYAKPHPIHDLYVVYSYGEHFPLFIYDHNSDTWLENSDGYSRTTSQHRSKAHPHCDTVKINTEQMEQVLNTGTIAGIVTPMNNAA